MVVLRAERQDFALGRADEGKRRDGAVLEKTEKRLSWIDPIIKKGLFGWTSETHARIYFQVLRGKKVYPRVPVHGVIGLPPHRKAQLLERPPARGLVHQAVPGRGVLA